VNFEAIKLINFKA